MENTTLKFKDYTVEIPDGTNLKEIYVEITSKFNLNCKMCFRRFWKDKVLDMSPPVETVFGQEGSFSARKSNHLQSVEKLKSYLHL